MCCDGKSVEFVVVVAVGHVAEPGSSTLPQHPVAGVDDVGSDGVGCVGFVAAVAHLMARDYTGIVAGTCVTVDRVWRFRMFFIYKF